MARQKRSLEQSQGTSSEKSTACTLDVNFYWVGNVNLFVTNGREIRSRTLVGLLMNQCSTICQTSSPYFEFTSVLQELNAVRFYFKTLQPSNEKLPFPELSNDKLCGYKIYKLRTANTCFTTSSHDNDDQLSRIFLK